MLFQCFDQPCCTAKTVLRLVAPQPFAIQFDIDNEEQSSGGIESLLSAQRAINCSGVTGGGGQKMKATFQGNVLRRRIGNALFFGAIGEAIDDLLGFAVVPHRSRKGTRKLSGLRHGTDNPVK